MSTKIRPLTVLLAVISGEILLTIGMPVGIMKELFLPLVGSTILLYLIIIVGKKHLKVKRVGILVLLYGIITVVLIELGRPTTLETLINLVFGIAFLYAIFKPVKATHA